MTTDAVGQSTDPWGSLARQVIGDFGSSIANNLDPNARAPRADREKVEAGAKFDWKVIGVGAVVLLVVAIVVKKAL